MKRGAIDCKVNSVKDRPSARRNGTMMTAAKASNAGSAKSMPMRRSAALRPPARASGEIGAVADLAIASPCIDVT